MFGDGRVGQQQLAEWRIVLDRLHRAFVDDIVGGLFAHELTQGEHHRFGHHQTLQRVGISAHALGMYPQPAQHAQGQAERAIGQHAQFRHIRPLHVVVGPVALVGDDQAIQRISGLAEGQSGQRDDGLAQHRVALVGHGAAAHLALVEGLLDLPHLGLLQGDDLGGDLAASAGQHRQDVGELGKAVVGDVAGDGRIGQAEQGHHPGPDRQRVIADRGQGSDRAAEHAHQQAWFAVVEPGAMAPEFIQPDRNLEAKGDGQGVLAMGAPGHQRVAVLARQFGQHRFEIGQASLDNGDGVLALQDDGRVHDVLGRRAVMDVLAGPVRAGVLEHPDERDDRMQGQVDLSLHLDDVHQLGPAFAGDLLGRPGRDHPELGLGLGQSDFDIEPFLKQSPIVKDGPHLVGAVEVLQKDGVGDVRGHGDARSQPTGMPSAFSFAFRLIFAC